MNLQNNNIKKEKILPFKNIIKFNEIENELIDKNNLKIVTNSLSVCIVFLKAESNGEKRPDLSYHLHFLISKIDGNKILIICLDTGSSISGSKNNIYEMLQNLCTDFIDYIFYSINRGVGNIRDHVLLNKSDKKLWEEFNNIKESSFFNNLVNKEYNNKKENINLENLIYSFKKNDFSIKGEIVEYSYKKNN